MLLAPIPSYDDARVRALRALDILDTDPEERFDRITRLASAMFSVPISLVSLVDRDRQWFKSCVGLSGGESDRATSFCGHVLPGRDVFVVPDATLDPRFADNPAVLGDPFVRFYAGAPIIADGHVVGTLCIVDREPRDFSEHDQIVLAQLATFVDHELGDHEAKRDQARRIVAERQVWEIAESVHDALVAFDPHGIVAYANAAAEGLLGDGSGSLVGSALTELVVSSDAATVADLLRRARRGETIQRRELTMTAPDGRLVVVDAAFGAVRVGERLLFTASGRDVTAERLAAHELDQLRQQHEMILQSTVDGIVLLRPDGTVRYANQAAHRLLGHTPGALVGVDLHAVAHGRRADGQPFPWADCPTHRALVDGVAVDSHRQRYWRADGSAVDLALTVAPVRDGDEVSGAVVVFSDVADQVRVERERDEFVSMVSHELRTPLTSLRGSLGLVRGGVYGELPDAAIPMLDVAVDSTGRLVRLVNDILDLQRLDAGRFTLDLGRHRLETLVATGVHDGSGLAIERQIRIHQSAADAEIVCDADRVVQIVTNLVGNAVKFSRDDTTVSVIATADDQVCRIWIADAGRGIPTDQIERVFDPFRQVEVGDARIAHGSGLGLPIARRLAEQHGGTLTAQSALGVGSTFLLTLPIAGPTPEVH